MGETKQDTEQKERVCHVCGEKIKEGKRYVEAKTRNGWAHFSCWYDGVPVKDRDGEIV